MAAAPASAAAGPRVSSLHAPAPPIGRTPHVRDVLQCRRARARETCDPRDASCCLTLSAAAIRRFDDIVARSQGERPCDRPHGPGATRALIPHKAPAASSRYAVRAAATPCTRTCRVHFTRRCVRERQRRLRTHGGRRRHGQPGDVVLDPHLVPRWLHRGRLRDGRDVREAREGRADVAAAAARVHARGRASAVRGAAARSVAGPATAESGTGSASWYRTRATSIGRAGRRGSGSPVSRQQQV